MSFQSGPCNRDYDRKFWAKGLQNELVTGEDGRAQITNLMLQNFKNWIISESIIFREQL